MKWEQIHSALVHKVLWGHLGDVTPAHRYERTWVPHQLRNQEGLLRIFNCNLRYTPYSAGLHAKAWPEIFHLHKCLEQLFIFLLLNQTKKAFCDRIDVSVQLAQLTAARFCVLCVHVKSIWTHTVEHVFGSYCVHCIFRMFAEHCLLLFRNVLDCNITPKSAG